MMTLAAMTTFNLLDIVCTFILLIKILLIKVHFGSSLLLIHTISNPSYIVINLKVSESVSQLMFRKFNGWRIGDFNLFPHTIFFEKIQKIFDRTHQHTNTQHSIIKTLQHYNTTTLKIHKFRKSVTTTHPPTMYTRCRCRCRH